MHKGMLIAGLLCLTALPAASASLDQRVSECAGPEKPELVCLVEAAPASWREAILADARMLRAEAGLGHKAVRRDDDTVLIPAILQLIALQASRSHPKQSLQERRWREIASLSSRGLITSARSVYLIQVKNEAMQERLAESTSKESLFAAVTRHMHEFQIEKSRVHIEIQRALMQRLLDDIGMSCASAAKCLRDVSKILEPSSPLWGGTLETMIDSLRQIARNDLAHLMELESP